MGCCGGAALEPVLEPAIGQRPRCGGHHRRRWLPAVAGPPTCRCAARRGGLVRPGHPAWGGGSHGPRFEARLPAHGPAPDHGGGRHPGGAGAGRRGALAGRRSTSAGRSQLRGCFPSVRRRTQLAAFHLRVRDRDPRPGSALVLRGDPAHGLGQRGRHLDACAHGPGHPRFADEPGGRKNSCGQRHQSHRQPFRDRRWIGVVFRDTRSVGYRIHKAEQSVLAPRSGRAPRRRSRSGSSTP